MQTVKKHSQGGRLLPYEKYHLDSIAYSEALREADAEHSGLMSAEALQNADKVPVPATATSPGKKGQYARDLDYEYFCYEDNKWVRLPMSLFHYYSSSSSVSSSSESSSLSSVSWSFSSTSISSESSSFSSSSSLTTVSSSSSSLGNTSSISSSSFGLSSQSSSSTANAVYHEDFCNLATWKITNNVISVVDDGVCYARFTSSPSSKLTKHYDVTPTRLRIKFKPTSFSSRFYFLDDLNNLFQLRFYNGLLQYNDGVWQNFPKASYYKVNQVNVLDLYFGATEYLVYFNGVYQGSVNPPGAGIDFNTTFIFYTPGELYLEDLLIYGDEHSSSSLSSLSSQSSISSSSLSSSSPSSSSTISSVSSLSTQSESFSSLSKSSSSSSSTSSSKSSSSPSTLSSVSFSFSSSSLTVSFSSQSPLSESSPSTSETSQSGISDISTSMSSESENVLECENWEIPPYDWTIDGTGAVIDDPLSEQGKVLFLNGSIDKSTATYASGYIPDTIERFAIKFNIMTNNIQGSSYLKVEDDMAIIGIHEEYLQYNSKNVWHRVSDVLIEPYKWYEIILKGFNRQTGTYRVYLNGKFQGLASFYDDPGKLGLVTSLNMVANYGSLLYVGDICYSGYAISSSSSLSSTSESSSSLTSSSISSSSFSSVSSITASWSSVSESSESSFGKTSSSFSSGSSVSSSTGSSVSSLGYSSSQSTKVSSSSISSSSLSSVSTISSQSSFSSSRSSSSTENAIFVEDWTNGLTDWTTSGTVSIEGTTEKYLRLTEDGTDASAYNTNLDINLWDYYDLYIEFSFRVDPNYADFHIEFLDFVYFYSAVSNLRNYWGSVYKNTLPITTGVWYKVKLYDFDPYSMTFCMQVDDNDPVTCFAYTLWSGSRTINKIFFDLLTSGTLDIGKIKIYGTEKESSSEYENESTSSISELSPSGAESKSSNTLSSSLSSENAYFVERFEDLSRWDVYDPPATLGTENGKTFVQLGIAGMRHKFDCGESYKNIRMVIEFRANDASATGDIYFKLHNLFELNIDYYDLYVYSEGSFTALTSDDRVTADTWHTIELRDIDWDNKTIDFYFDGVFIGAIALYSTHIEQYTTIDYLDIVNEADTLDIRLIKYYVEA